MKAWPRNKLSENVIKLVFPFFAFLWKTSCPKPAPRKWPKQFEHSKDYPFFVCVVDFNSRGGASSSICLLPPSQREMKKLKAFQGMNNMAVRRPAASTPLHPNPRLNSLKDWMTEIRGEKKHENKTACKTRLEFHQKSTVLGTNIGEPVAGVKLIAFIHLSTYIRRPRARLIDWSFFFAVVPVCRSI